MILCVCYTQIVSSAIDENMLGGLESFSLFICNICVLLKACAGLNGMPLGDKKLIVQRASVGAKNAQNVCIINAYFLVVDAPALSDNVPSVISCIECRKRKIKAPFRYLINTIMFFSVYCHSLYCLVFCFLC